MTPIAGFGLKFGAFTFDLGAGYDFQLNQGLGSFSLGLTF